MPDTLLDRKRCFDCGLTKSAADFNLHRGNRDGLQKRCRSCQAKADRRYQRAHPEVGRAQKKRERARDATRLNERQAAWEAANAEKVAAHRAVRNAIRRGDLKRPGECEDCGGFGQRIEAHHTDYARPLEVQWLCSTCHGRERAFAEPEVMGEAA